MMLVLKLCLGFLLIFVAVDGYYYRTRTYNYQNSIPRKRKFVYRVHVHEVAEPGPWQQRSNTRQSDERRRTPARSYEKGPRTDNRRTRTEEYQRQVNARRVPAVRNNEKGPRTDNRRTRTEEYQRQVNARRVQAVRNNEKGPRQSRSEESQRQNNARRTTVVRKNEKESRRRNGETSKGDISSVMEVYHRQRSRNDNGRSRTQTNKRRERIYNNRETSKISNYQDTLRKKLAMGYKGCKDSGKYCNYWKSKGCCELQFGRVYCKKTCAFCVPMSPVCPRSYKFGCCWNGNPAEDRGKRTCPPCKNLNDRVCNRKWVYKDCDLHEPNSLTTRSLCPQSCGACDDYQ